MVLVVPSRAERAQIQGFRRFRSRHELATAEGNVSSSAARCFPGVLPERSSTKASLSCADATDSDRISRDIENGARDEDLLVRLQNRDVQALGELYRRFARLVYSVSVRILGDPSEAEDLVHEVFLTLLRKCNSFDPGKGSARSWIIQLTYSKCFDWRDYLRARHGYGQPPTKERGEVEVGPLRRHQDLADLSVWNGRMKEAFKSLTKEQRTTLILYYFRGYTFHETAEELGYSYGNVKHHVYRGIENLRRLLFDPTDRAVHSGSRSTQSKALRAKGNSAR